LIQISVQSRCAVLERYSITDFTHCPARALLSSLIHTYSQMTELVLQSPFGEVAALLVLAAAVGFVGTLLRHPLVVSFIAVGLLAGPAALGIVHSNEQIELLSDLGIAVLLFLVGIKLDVKLIRSLGSVALTTGLGQVVFTAIVGELIAVGLGFSLAESMYAAAALTFSSTIIIVKLLSDRREIDSLHGQVSLGLLIVQDLVVVLAMIALSAVGIGASSDAAGRGILGVLAAGGATLALVLFFVRYVADPLTERLARAPELLICFAIAQTALFAAVGDAIGFGKELGGLLAGISLASTRYREAISSRLAPLRDFLLLFFFIGLGSRIDVTTLGAYGVAAVVFSLFVLLGKPLIMLVIMAAMRFTKRTGFLAGVTVAQISEFSLIFVAMGVSIGHIDDEILGLVTLVGLITIAASTYMVTYSHQLYAFFEPMLGIFERRSGGSREMAYRQITGVRPPDVLLFGLGRFGTAIGTRLRKCGVRVLGIDFNPALISRWRELGYDAEYGDLTDAEFIATLPLHQARWAVSTVPAHTPGVTHDDPRLAITHALRAAGFRGRIAVTTHHGADAPLLRDAGADLVLEPFQDAADRAVELITSGAAPERVPGEQLDEEQVPG
jgi:Kef-type K+ transport system membrane component KefB